ncbi:MAG: bifunctional adenosylcobinamide kinase/adenosylcobinamide-phosphate guanylyltransferase [Gammaproteobacteria bacterium]|nr:bifunctional adenosylcobinamide kinase/adenosylcobinamide-phosphate guanylyltransferase [Gammaproteobacteria bacterium]
MKSLILGGMKSGKSRFAEQLATQLKQPVVYIATAQAWDDEMRERIRAHQQQRPNHWQTVETPLHLAAALKQQDARNRTILVDCLTLWITQLLCHHNPALLAQELTAFQALLPTLQANLILVSNETNMGVIPMDALSRRFCDTAGKLHQQLAPVMDSLVLTVAGLPLYLKGKPYELDIGVFGLS